MSFENTARVIDQEDLDVSPEVYQRLSKDLKEAAKLMSRDEARYLVDSYYSMQNFRVQAAGKVRSSGKEPAAVLGWVFGNAKATETDIKAALGIFARQYAVGQWLQGICGIGPVLSAAFLATLDVRDKPTAGHWWRFAGLDPSLSWEKGQKRPWNSRLKTLCFKAGECFIKVQNKDSDFYGKLYAKRKEYEQKKNEAGEYAEQAAAGAKRVGKTTEAYKHYSEGKLSPGHIHARARRYAVKMFLSHLHEVCYRDYYGEAPVKPYAFEKCEGDHRHYVAPPEIETKGKSLRELWG